MDTSWNTRYDTGIRIIDEQHQELFRIVEALRRMVQDGTRRTEVEALLEDLVTCSERHFATEEGIMARYGYPDLTQHVSEHATMLTSLHELLAKFQESDQAMAMLVPTFMEGWLKHHISDGDFGFVTFLKARNLA
ncbi:hemerythrin [Geothrix limicola]|uniref:Hemerythrin n=1 Tax=Geothrix limicola TaxID=2927978 RepID=A0ABQ5QB42_9BACT|nr:bacteriohemerythrin [Geothrix limicola]GLH71670.1 hemerythrin [Geothrix limicola]